MKTAHRTGEAASDSKTAGKPAIRNRPSAWLWSWRVLAGAGGCWRVLTQRSLERSSSARLAASTQRIVW